MKDFGQKRKKAETDKSEICGGFYDFLKKALNHIGFPFVWLLKIVLYCLKLFFDMIRCVFLGYINRYMVLSRKEKTVFWNLISIFFVVVLLLCIWLGGGQRPWLLLFVIPFSILFLYPTESAEKLNRFQVRPYWDNFPEVDPRVWDKFVFSGRKDILKKIKGWLFLTKGGSLLINGVRGVGKTALVYTAIQQWKYSIFWRRFGGKGLWRYPLLSIKYFLGVLSFLLPFLLRQKITVVPIDAGAIFQDTAVDDPKMKETLIKAIIRALRNTRIETRRISNQVDELFQCSISTKALNSMETREENGFIARVTQKNFENFLKLFFVSLIPLALKFVGLDVFRFFGFLSNLEFVLPLIFGLSISVLYVYEKKHKRETSLLLDKRRTEYLYTKLGEILDNESEIFVFIFDELDKLGNVSAVKFVKNIKNLINLSNSKFIFLNDEKNVLDDLISSENINKINNAVKTDTVNTSPIEVGDEPSKDDNQGKLSETVEPADFFQKKYGVGSTTIPWKVFLPNADAEDIKSYIKRILVLSGRERKEFDIYWKKVISGHNLSVGTENRLVDLLILVFYLYYETSGVFNEVKNKIRSMLIYDFRFKALFSRKVVPFLRFSKSAFKGDEWKDKKRKAMLGYVMYRIYKDNHFDDIDHYLENYLLTENSAEYLRIRETDRVFVSGYIKRYGEGRLLPKQYVERVRGHLDSLSRAILNISKKSGEEDEMFVIGANAMGVNELDLFSLPAINGFTTTETNLFVAIREIRSELRKIGSMVGWTLEQMLESASADYMWYGDGKLYPDYSNVKDLLLKTVMKNTLDDFDGEKYEESNFDKELSSLVDGSVFKFKKARNPVDQEVVRVALENLTDSIKLLKANLRTLVMRIVLEDILGESIDHYSPIDKNPYEIKIDDDKSARVPSVLLKEIDNGKFDSKSSISRLKKWYFDSFKRKTFIKVLKTYRSSELDDKLYKRFGQKPYSFDLRYAGHSVNRVVVELKGDCDYWRAGFLLGAPSYDKMNGFTVDRVYPLIHIYKNGDDNNIYYCVYSEKDYGREALLDENGNKLMVENVLATDEISMEVERVGKEVVLYVNKCGSNRKEIHRSKIRSNKWNYGWFNIWGDQHGWDVVVKKLVAYYR